MEITVTMTTSTALARVKQPGQLTTYKAMELSGPPEQVMDGVLAFIWAHLPQDERCPRWGWPWEA